MAPEEAAAELVRIFSGPRSPPGKDRHHHRQYDLVRLDDGTVAFIRNAFDAEMERIFAEVMDEIFGPDLADIVNPPLLPK
jgi:hypothetical protein